LQPSGHPPFAEGAVAEQVGVRLVLEEYTQAKVRTAAQLGGGSPRIMGFCDKNRQNISI